MDFGIQNRVVKFVADATNLDQSKIRPETTLLGDLGIDGDDAEDFILSYAKTFEVDLTQFRFTDYFGGEGVFPSQIPSFFARLIKGLKGENPHVIADKLPIRVKDLIQAAEEKRWLPAVASIR